ncbi:MAG: hypothetical protein ACK4ZQ_04405 [Bacteroidota bacterium]|jgi:hypothetical protein
MKKYFILSLLLLCLAPNLNAQFDRPNSKTKNAVSLINWDKTNRLRREPYFATPVFEDMYYRFVNDTTIHHGWVYGGMLTPRTIDSVFLYRLSEGNKPNIIGNFYCSPMWGYHWVQVRFMSDRWRGFGWNANTRNWGGSQVGGFLIGCTSKGLFIAQETELAYIPYSQIRNVRRGQSLGNSVNSRSKQRYGFNNYGSGLDALIAAPFVGTFHALSGVSPQKVHRFYGDSTGMDFPGWVQGANAWAESRNSLSDFPKAVLQKNRRVFKRITREAMPTDKLDQTEQVADRIWKHEIPLKSEVIRTDVNANDVVVRKNVVTAIFDKTPQFSDNKSVGIPTLELDKIEADSALPVTNEEINKPQQAPAESVALEVGKPMGPQPLPSLFDQRSNMKIRWAYEGYDATKVDPKIIKMCSNIRSSVLSDAQMNALNNKHEIQFLAIYLITSNGLLMNGLAKFTPDQKLMLEKVAPMFAEEASAEAVLNARDMAESDIVNLEKLFEQLNR